jgi:hypothetical protein
VRLLVFWLKSVIARCVVWIIHLFCVSFFKLKCLYIRATLELWWVCLLLSDEAPRPRRRERRRTTAPLLGNRRREGLECPFAPKNRNSAVIYYICAGVPVRGTPLRLRGWPSPAQLAELHIANAFYDVIPAAQSNSAGGSAGRGGDCIVFYCNLL